MSSSPSASESGLPCLEVRISARFSRFATINSYHLRRVLERCLAVSLAHAGSARSAASTPLEPSAESCGSLASQMLIARLFLPQGDVSQLRRHQCSRSPAEVTGPSDASEGGQALRGLCAGGRGRRLAPGGLQIRAIRSSSTAKKGRARYRAAESGRKRPEGH